MMENQHTKDEKALFPIAFNLIAACFISGIVIGAVHFVTAPVAAQKAEELRQESMLELVPEADEFKTVDGKEDWILAQKKGSAIAYIVPAESKGYGGAIKMLVAVGKDAKVLDFTILEHNETPGLGDNAQKPEFRKQFAGKSAESLEVTKNPAEKEKIQAMTGATISSKAVTKAVRDAAEKVDNFIKYQTKEGK